MAGYVIHLAVAKEYLRNRNIEFKECDFTNDLKRHSVKVIDESICEDAL